jgi:four helix bundle protein
LHKLLIEKKEFVLSKQILRSGTSIGANIREAEYAESKPDFIHKLKIALKETAETEHWLELLYQSGYISEFHFTNIRPKTQELIRLLTSIVNTTRSNNY